MSGQLVESHVSVVLPSTRGDDLIRTMTENAGAGLPHCWTVDPRAQTLTTHTIVESPYAPTAVHGRGTVADLDLGSPPSASRSRNCSADQSPDTEKCW